MAKTQEEVIEEMRADIARELGVEPENIIAGARFKEDLDADSLDLVQVVLVLEERFDIKVPDEEMTIIKTVGQAADLVISKQSAVG